MSKETIKPLHERINPEILKVISGGGDLSKLNLEQRSEYVLALCEAHDLDPLGRPFSFMGTDDNGVILYATKNCSDQLRRKHSIQVTIKDRGQVAEGVYGVIAVATIQEEDADPLSDESIGTVSVAGLTGVALANAYMAAETKAKRRATLSLVGIGMIDETEARELTPRKAPEATATKTDAEDLADRDAKILAAEKEKAIRLGIDPAQMDPYKAPEQAKRTRRTKEQIAADSAAKGAVTIDAETGKPEETAQAPQEPEADTVPACFGRVISDKEIANKAFCNRKLGELSMEELHTLNNKWCALVPDDCISPGKLQLRNLIREVLAIREGEQSKPAAE